MSLGDDIVYVLRGVAVWLLALCVFFGPAAGGSVALAALAATGQVSCPCDDAKANHARDRDADPCDEKVSDDDAHEPGDPCDDECPEGCPGCGCCLGVAMAVLGRSLTLGAESGMPARVLAPIRAPASGAVAGVFRPPRSRT